MPGQKQQITNSAHTEEKQRRLDDVGKWDGRVLQLQSLHNACRNKRHITQDYPSKCYPKMSAHQFRVREFYADELRHDVVNRAEDYHGEITVGIELCYRRCKPGEIEDLVHIQ